MSADLDNAAPDWRVVSAPRRIALGLPPSIGKAATDNYADKREAGEVKQKRKA